MPHLHSLNLYVINNGLKKCETEINGTIGLVYRLCFPCDLVLQIHLAAKYLNNLFIVKNNVLSVDTTIVLIQHTQLICYMFRLF